MGEFTRAELRELAPGDLADLIGLAEGETPWECAMTLGLDPTNPNDRKAVETAVAARWDVPEPFSPPIGAGQPGVRSDLTPAVQEPATPMRGQDAGELVDLGTIEADGMTARTLAEMMDQSVISGEPFMGGTFAMYAAPDGSVVMVTEGIGDGVRRSVIPRQWVRTALSLAAGEGGIKNKMLGKIFGRG